MSVLRSGLVTTALICATAALGCGSSNSTGSGTTTAETLQPVPPLPAGWHRVTNSDQGFAFGLPNRWRASQTRQRASLVRSPDNRVAISIAADRTDEALRQPLASYASGALSSLPGLRGLRVGSPVPFRDFYDASVVRGSGQGGGVHQSLELIALRRSGVSTFVALIARRSAAGPKRYEPAALRIIRSLRGRPVPRSG